MSNATANSDEMKTLKREAAELQERRQQNYQIASEGAEQQEQSDPEEKMDQGARRPTGEADQPDSGAPDLVQQLELYLNDIEETALERPALALLTTFALGVIVGHLFTRKWEE